MVLKLTQLFEGFNHIKSINKITEFVKILDYDDHYVNSDDHIKQKFLMK